CAYRENAATNAGSIGNAWPWQPALNPVAIFCRKFLSPALCKRPWSKYQWARPCFAILLRRSVCCHCYDSSNLQRSPCWWAQKAAGRKKNYNKHSTPGYKPCAMLVLYYVQKRLAWRWLLPARQYWAGVTDNSGKKPERLVASTWPTARIRSAVAG